MPYSLFLLFVTFFKIGLFTIGGGYAMLPMIIDEVTAARQWCTVDEVIDFIAVSESTPGPFSINLSTFVGMRIGGVPGIIAAALGLVLPSFIIILVIVKFFNRFIEYRYVKAALYTLRPATIGLMCAAAVSLALASFNLGILPPDFSRGIDIKALFAGLHYIELAIFIIMFFLTRRLKLNAYMIIIVSALLGIALYSLKAAVIA